MKLTAIGLVLFCAATWRLANLLVNENGPFGMFRWFRRWVAMAIVKAEDEKSGLLSRLPGRLLTRFHALELISCEYCASVWIGIFFTALYLVAPTVALYVALPFALSTGAILIKHIVYTLRSIDTRYDQMNQAHEEQQKVWREVTQNVKGGSDYALRLSE